MRLLLRVSLLAVLLAAAPLGQAWGPRGHELVNEHAINTLPPELRPFFEANRAWLIANASAPDHWIDSDPTEAPHHFMDMERYARKFEEMPKTREDALAKAGERFVKDSGDLLWWLPHSTHELADAMRAGDRQRILRWAVAVAHFAGDIAQPLHTTENYNGQLSGQPGAHARFETQTVNHVAGFLKLQPQPARILADPFNSIFATIARSWRRRDEILKADRQALSVDPSRGPAYNTVMATHVRGLIEQQLSEGATLTGSLWLTAWVEAGRPDLSKLAETAGPAEP